MGGSSETALNDCTLYRVDSQPDYCTILHAAAQLGKRATARTQAATAEEPPRNTKGGSTAALVRPRISGLPRGEHVRCLLLGNAAHTAAGRAGGVAAGEAAGEAGERRGARERPARTGVQRPGHTYLRAPTLDGCTTIPPASFVAADSVVDVETRRPL